MAVLFLESGGMCHVSEEDLEYASRVAWSVWLLKPSGNPCAWTRLQRHGRRFDLFLHRLIAVRANPDLAKRNFTVTPVDGDYLNCERANLETSIRRKKPGPARKPGSARSRFLNFSPEGDLADLWRPVIAAQGR